MLRRATIFVSAFALAVSAAGIAGAAVFNASNYTITNLGGIDANFSGDVKLTFQAYNLTDAGLVTGYGSYGWRGSGFPSIPTMYLGQWSASTGFVPVYNTGKTSGAAYVSAMGNDSGAISYWTWDSPHGYVRTGGVSTVVPSDAAGVINSSGLSAGGNWWDGTPGAAYDTVSHTTYTLPGLAMSINNAGQVGGSVAWGSGFVWTKTASTYWGAAGTSTTLSGFGEVLSLSPDGRYAGGTDASWTTAKVYDAQTHTYLSSFSTAGEVYAIGSNGWMGGDTDGSGGFGGTAWLWDGTTLHNLNTELAAAFPSAVSGYTINAVWGINSSSQLLVWGRRADSSIISFVLSPVPEPSTMLLTAVGLVGLLAYAWRKRK